MRILLLNGPNLNLLGRRAPEVYGSDTLEDVAEQCGAHSARLGHRLEAFQSNHEGELIDAIHAARETADGIVFNPGAFSHTSYALHDAIEAAGLPTVEIHISNVREREPWRRISVTEPACVHQIFGRGVAGYLDAISHLHYRAVHPPLTLPYGPHPDQVADLRLPDAPGPHPVAVLVHGGGWADPYTRDLMDGAAVDLTRRGTATWNVEYRRVPPVGGWRDSMADVSAAVGALSPISDDHRLDLERVTVIGHSAGAQLGFFAARTASVRPVGFVSLAGMLDLEDTGSGFDDLISAFLGDDRRAHLAKVDPMKALPGGFSTVAVHGRRDRSVPPDQSRRFVEASLAAGDPSRLVELADADHMDVISPLAAGWEEVARACLGGLFRFEDPRPNA